MNTKLDMSKHEEQLKQGSILEDLNLINSTFVPPKTQVGSNDPFPIKLRHFSGVDFGFATESCKQMTSNFSSLESITLDWRKTSSDLVEFLMEHGSSLTSLKHLAYHELSNGPLSITPLLTRDTRKLDRLELNLRGSTLSRILDMLYTQISKVTVLQVASLTADVQLFIKGVDAGLLPSHIYPPGRIQTKSGNEEINGDKVRPPCMPELETKLLTERFDCIQSKENQILVFKIVDTKEKTELIVKAEEVLNVH